MPIYVGGRDDSLRVLGAGPGEGDPASKVLRLLSPSVAQKQAYFFTENGLTVSRLRAAIKGAAPSVTWTLRFASTLDAVGTEVITGGTTTNDTTNGSDDILFTNAAIPANSFVWLDVTAVGGTVAELSVTVIPVS